MSTSTQAVKKIAINPVTLKPEAPLPSDKPASTPAPAPAPTSAAKAAKVRKAPERIAGKPKSYTKTLRGASNETLEFWAYGISHGQFTSYVSHRTTGVDPKDAKKTITVSLVRGASKVHPTMQDAIDAVDAGVVVALAAGWTKPAHTGPVGGGTKADGFTLDTLPKPKK